jgi:hypothetical protein
MKIRPSARKYGLETGNEPTEEESKAPSISMF